MAEKQEEETAIRVAVRVRPLNGRERDEGHRCCVSFDEPTKQVVLTAVDRNTLLQLRGSTAKGYAFDKRFGQEETSDSIYDSCISGLVESCFKGYNATVLAYGQTGSGKTHTMAGGVGIHGKREEGVIPRVIRHVFALVEAIRKKEKPGEKTDVSACALELYNEDLLDLSMRSNRKDASEGWDAGKGGSSALKLQERPVGKEGRVVPEVVGVREMQVKSAEDLKKFFDDCMENRSTSSTKLNDRSSRSHAIFTITIHRTVVEVMNELGEDFRAKVRTVEFSSKLHLVDLAGSERVKRSGVTGKELKEATHINSGLLALGNVIVALAAEGDGKKKGHIPYRDSKLTRLLQDSIGGNSLTVLISCISPSEVDFEETNNTLKYANRACHIKNTPLPNKYTTIEEDLLPTLPMGAGGSLGMLQLHALLEDHERLKEMRERKAKEKAERDAKRLTMLMALREEQIKTKGYQRLRASQYDELRRQFARGPNIPSNAVICDDSLMSFRTSKNVSASADFSSSSPAMAAAMRRSMAVPRSANRDSAGGREASPFGTPRKGTRASAPKAASGQTFAEWQEMQKATAEVEGEVAAAVVDDFFHAGDEAGEEADAFIVEDDEVPAVATAGQARTQTIDDFIVEDDDHVIVDDEVAAAPSSAAAGAAGPESSQRDGEAAAGLSAAEAAAMGGASASVVVTPTDSRESSSGQDGGATASTAVADTAAAQKAKFKRGAARKVDAPAEDGVDMIEDDDGVYDEPAADEEEAAINEEAIKEALAAAGLEEVAEEEEEEEEPYDPIQDDAVPKLLARFKVNTSDVLAVFKAVSKEDFQDVIGLLPENTPLPASDKMTYLLARLENANARADLNASLQRVGQGATMNEAVGPAVGCLMATFGTNMISSCIFEFDDPADLKYFGVEERIELWGLQIPHNSVRPTLAPIEDDAAAREGAEAATTTVTWSSVDRLNMSIGLLYALCNHARECNVRCGFCVPRPQLLRRWLQAGVRMKSITTALKLIYPETAHDYEYYKASTVAYFMVHEVKEALEKVLGVVPAPDVKA